ncbi:MAG: helix-turn-helix domain-containing protein [Pseudomonadota bacterium]
MTDNAEDRQSPLARRIEDLRQRVGLSQSALSRQAGLSPSAVYDIVTNPERSPRLSTVVALAEALDVDPMVLISGEQAPVPTAGDPLQPCPPPMISSLIRPASQQFFVAAEATELHRAGEVLAVDPDLEPNPGAVVVIEIDGHPRAGLMAPPYVLIPQNKGGMTAMIYDPRRVSLMGVVVASLQARSR